MRPAPKPRPAKSFTDCKFSIRIAAVRIIAGQHKGRRLVAPKGLGTRPTPDRVKEALFSILAGHEADATVLDLFAGTGGLGLEALSRGAKHATFVDQDRAAQAALRENIAALRVTNATLLTMSAERVLQQLAKSGQRFDLVFLDPPYAAGLLPKCLASLVTLNLLLPCAIVVCEHHSQDPAPESVSPLERTDTRSFGDVSLSLFVFRDDSPAKGHDA